SAGAGRARVGVVDREALLLDRVREVDGGALEVGDAHLVEDDLDTVEVADRVAVEQTLVEVQLVDQAGAAARLHRETQAKVVATLLLQQAADLGGGDVRQGHSVGGGLGGLAHGGLRSAGGASVRWSTPRDARLFPSSLTPPYRDQVRATRGTTPSTSDAAADRRGSS